MNLSIDEDFYEEIIDEYKVSGKQKNLSVELDLYHELERVCK